MKTDHVVSLAGYFVGALFGLLALIAAANAHVILCAFLGLFGVCAVIVRDVWLILEEEAHADDDLRAQLKVIQRQIDQSTSTLRVARNWGELSPAQEARHNALFAEEERLEQEIWNRQQARLGRPASSA